MKGESGLVGHKISKVYIGILVFNLAYLLLFCFLFTSVKNYEFLLYAATVAFFVIFIGCLHFKFNFGPVVLIGLSLWGLLHMLGGFVRVTECFQARFSSAWCFIRWYTRIAVQSM